MLNCPLNTARRIMTNKPRKTTNKLSQNVGSANIESVTAELGRHAGDAGEMARIDSLTKLRASTRLQGKKAPLRNR